MTPERLVVIGYLIGSMPASIAAQANNSQRGAIRGDPSANAAPRSYCWYAGRGMPRASAVARWSPPGGEDWAAQGTLKAHAARKALLRLLLRCR
ncbi:exported hypothetical protein [uncultured Stenotrophomonas sp.]|uniref:Uncharacterized protein n=1 Tax=uncultured Stenotrophomonas sp. TaxID=165438 RepID=A0A1Y5Q6F6_9GAMM|nr:exported hypothetical protein [uncultured Stenotrophomonas sp.]